MVSVLGNNGILMEEVISFVQMKRERTYQARVIETNREYSKKLGETFLVFDRSENS